MHMRLCCRSAVPGATENCTASLVCREAVDVDEVFSSPAAVGGFDDWTNLFDRSTITSTNSENGYPFKLLSSTSPYMTLKLESSSLSRYITGVSVWPMSDKAINTALGQNLTIWLHAAQVRPPAVAHGSACAHRSEVLWPLVALSIAVGKGLVGLRQEEGC